MFIELSILCMSAGSSGYKTEVQKKFTKQLSLRGYFFPSRHQYALYLVTGVFLDVCFGKFTFNHRCICPHYLKNAFQYVKNPKKYFTCIYQHSMSECKVSQRTNIFVVYVKRQKKVLC
jgi:hypothetical protein